MAKRPTITKSKLAALTGAKPSTPQPTAGLDGRVKQLEREIAALWTANGELQCELNRLKNRRP
jgi:hypothetical protein